MPAVGVVFPNGGKYANLIILETTILLYHVFSGNVIPNRYWFLPHFFVVKLIYYIVRLSSRICAHNLEIEKGRYFQINRTERFCKIYKDLEIEDENHFLWQGEKYRKEREILFKKVSLCY